MKALASSAARAIIAHHSKSFALASKLLPAAVRDDAVVLYAYCRRVDDAVDEAPAEEQAEALAGLRVELDELYRGLPQAEPLLAALQAVIVARAIPRFCFEDLLSGMEMDVRGTRYHSRDELLLYCYRVAGTVGLMMCHVMDAKQPEALDHGKDLGIAMQLTNIARDVVEDWRRDRLYLPEDLLAQSGAPALGEALGGPLPQSAAPALKKGVSTLLTWADEYYASGDRGLRYLSFRCAAAVYAARLVYSSIGTVLRGRGCDPLAGRAVVPAGRKLMLALRALVAMAFATALGACAHSPPPGEGAAAWRTVETTAAEPVVEDDAPAVQAGSPEAAAAPRAQPDATPAPNDPPAQDGGAEQADVTPPAPSPGEVVVDVIGLDSAQGLLLVALYRDGKGFPERGSKAFGKRVAKARPGNARVIFRDVPPGPFAVVVHHDADKDYEMDTNLFGAPTEGYGFSRDASASFGPPGFADAKLTLSPSERKRVPIHMKY